LIRFQYRVEPALAPKTMNSLSHIQPVFNRILWWLFGTTHFNCLFNCFYFDYNQL